MLQEQREGRADSIQRSLTERQHLNWISKGQKETTSSEEDERLYVQVYLTQISKLQTLSENC